MLLMIVTRDVFHELTSWLKAMALANMLLMFVTLDMTQVLTSWLKAEAPLNMATMLVTFDVFQPPDVVKSGAPPLLKATGRPEALANMKLMSVTLTVFKLLRF